MLWASVLWGRVSDRVGHFQLSACRDKKGWSGGEGRGEREREGKFKCVYFDRLLFLTFIKALNRSFFLLHSLSSLSPLAWLAANTEQAWHSLSPAEPSNWINHTRGEATWLTTFFFLVKHGIL
jgi:hypothetical protein